MMAARAENLQKGIVMEEHRGKAGVVDSTLLGIRFGGVSEWIQVCPIVCPRRA
jgi:hypothetical protein